MILNFLPSTSAKFTKRNTSASTAEGARILASAKNAIIYLFLLLATLMPASLLAQENASAYDAGNAVAQRETHVTPAQALNVGYTFMRTSAGNGTRSSGAKSSTVRKQAMQLVYTGQAYDSLTGTTTDCYYVFALQPKGFVIVAADERVEPILGYSYDNDFAVANMPDHVRAWLGSYEKQIQAVVKNNLQAEPASQAKWSRLKSGQSTGTRSGGSVGPLLTTTWDQGQYYNSLCPADANGPGGHVWGGCVATAMAQIINYWEWPEMGVGTHSYSSTYGNHSANYGNTIYDYSIMPDALSGSSTPEQINAVATLIYHCGVSVNMDYGVGGSAAPSVSVPGALQSYFAYIDNGNIIAKSDYSDNDWEAILRNELDSLRPVYYSGSGTGGGHAFICDGYSDDGTFHINWGWSGYYNGNFTFASLTPGSNDFSSYQQAIIGISVTGPFLRCSHNALTLAAAAGSESEAKQLQIRGHSLGNNITVTAGNGFTVSTDGSNFHNSLTLPQNGGNIYVKYTPVSSSDVSHTMTVVSGSHSLNINLYGTAYTEVCLPPSYLVGAYDGSAVNLSWNAPVTYSDGSPSSATLSWDSSFTCGRAGFGTDMTLYMMHRFDSQDLAPYNNYVLKSISFYAYTGVSSYRAVVFTGCSHDGNFTPGNLVVSQEIPLSTLTTDSWNTVLLNTPVLIDADEEIAFGVVVHNLDNVYVVPIGNGTFAPNKGQIFGIDYTQNPDASGVTWYDFCSILGENDNIALKGGIEKIAGNVSHYDIYRGSSLIGNSTTTSYTDNHTIIENTPYMVSAIWSSGCSADATVMVSPGTSTPPTVVSHNVTLVNPTTVTCGGNVTSEGSTSVTAKGVCWGTSPNPTITGAHTNDGSGLGEFTSTISELSENTTYYVRAYALNSSGISYGEQKTFTTSTWGTPCTLTFELNDSYGDGWTGNIIKVHNRGTTQTVTLDSGFSGIVTLDVYNGSLVLEWMSGNYTSECSFTVSGPCLYYQSSGIPTNGNFLSQELDCGGTSFLPDFTYNISNTCNSVMCEFTSAGENVQPMSWDFGNGSTSSQNPAIFEYTSSGTYTVSMTASSATCPTTATVSKTISVKVPIPSHTTFDTVVCAADLPLTWHGHTFTGPETYTGTFTTALNCDSTVTLNVTVGVLTAFLEDDFNDGVIDPAKWTYTGNTVLEEDGLLKLQQNVTDQDVHLRSVNLDVPADGKVSMDRRFMVHRSNEFYYGATCHYLNGNDNSYVNLQYLYTAYYDEGYYDYDNPRVGIYVTSNIGGEAFSTRLCDITFDTWLTEHVALDFAAGTLTYSTNTSTYSINVPGLASQTVDYYTVAFRPSGWWTGHQHYVDYVSIYGAEVPDLVTTSPVTNITANTATCGGNIPANDCILFNERGVCWSTSQNPTLADAHTSDGTGTGSFTSQLTGLEPSTTYYVRAYSINSMGTAYGEEVTFTTANGCNGISIAITGNENVCETEPVVLTANVSADGFTPDNLHYTWYESGLIRDNMAFGLGDSNVYSEYLYPRTEPYLFSVEVYYGAGCVAQSGEYLVYVHPMSEVIVSASETAVCEGGEVTLSISCNDYNNPMILYTWYRNGVVIPGATQPTITDIPSAGNNIYTGVASLHGCSASDQITIHVNEIPETPIVTVDNTTIFDGGQVTLTVANPVDGAIYTWYRNGMLIDGATQATLVDMPMTIDGEPATYNYSVMAVLNNSGCVSEISEPAVVTVSAMPMAMVTVDGGTVFCEGSSTTLHVDVTPQNGPTYTYQWYEGDVLIPGATSADYVVAEPARTTSYNFHVVVSANGSHNVTAYAPAITVVAQPVVIASISESTVCAGGTATLTALVSGGVAGINGLNNYSYQWFRNADSTAELVSTDYTYTTAGDEPAGTYAYWVAISNDYGCNSQSESVMFTVADVPTVIITPAAGYDATVCEGGSTAIQAVVSGGYGTPLYQWFKNGLLLPNETGTVLHIHDLMANAGDVYAVSVVQEGSSCGSGLVSAAISSLVTVNAPATVILGDSIMCEGGSMLFALTIPEADSDAQPVYTWFKDDQPMDIVSSDYILASEPGLYKVAVSVNGCTSESEEYYVTYHSSPQLHLTATETDICVGGHTAIFADIVNWSDGTILYSWSDSYGSGSSYDFSSEEVGLHTITVTATNTASGCQGTNSITINVNDLPETPVVTVNQATVFDGGQVTLTVANPIDGAIYTWYRNGMLIDGATQATLVDTPTTIDGEPATYNYSVMAVLNNSGCVSEISEPAVVTVSAMPMAMVTVDGSTVLCEGSSTTLHVEVVPADNPSYTYQWYEDDVPIPGATSADYVVTKPVRDYAYNFSVMVSDSNGGFFLTADAPAITVVPQPVVILADSIMCESYAMLTALVVTAVDPDVPVVYTWYKDDQPMDIVSSDYILASEPGLYKVAVSVNGCTSESEEYYVTYHSSPQLQLAASETNICIGGTTTINADAEGDGNISYSWSVDNVFGSNYTFVPDHAGTFTFEVTATDELSGCLTSDQITINVNDLPETPVVTVNQATIFDGGQVTLTVANPVDGAIYTWYRNGMLIDGATQSILYDTPMTIDGEPATYNYSVMAALYNSGCASGISEPAVVTVSATPMAMVTVDGSTVLCEGSSTTLHVDVVPAGNPSYTYQWYEDDVPIPGATSADYVVTKPARDYAYNFSVTVSDSNGGFFLTADAPAITVVAQPVVILGDSIMCEGGSMLFALTIPEADSDAQPVYTWFKDDQPMDNATSDYILASEPGLYKVAVSVNGCTSESEEYYVTYHSSPQLHLTASETNICIGGTTTINADAEGDGNISYSWSVDNVFGSNYTFVPDHAGTFTFEVTATDELSGCLTSDQITINVNDLPETPVVTVNQATVFEGGQITLTVTNPVDGALYTWYRNGMLIDGATQATLVDTPTTIDGEPATYNYSVMAVLNNSGCVSEISEPAVVTVSAMPMAMVTVDGSTVLCEGSSTTLHVEVVPADNPSYTYQWYEDDVPIPGATSADYVVAEPARTTSYNFHVVVSANGSDNVTAYAPAITVVPQPVVILADSIMCEGYAMLTALVVTAVDPDVPVVYTWFKDDQPMDIVSSDYILASEPGLYKVAVSVNGCTSESEEYYVTYHSSPQLQLTASETNICIGGTTTINADAEGDGNISYSWSVDNVFGSNYTFVPDHAGTFTFEVTATDELSGCLTSDQITINVNDLPETPVVTVNQATVFEGGQITLTVANPVDGALYTWYRNGMLIDGATQSTLVDAPMTVGGEPATYTYSVMAALYNSGCASGISEPAVVTVSATPMAMVTVNGSTVLCEGSSTTLHVDVVPAGNPSYTYQWYEDGMLIPGATSADYVVTRSVRDYAYNFSVMVSDTNGGFFLTADAPAITVVAQPVVTINGSLNVCETDFVSLTANVDSVGMSVGNLHFSWYESGLIMDNMAFGLGDSNTYMEYLYPRSEPYTFTVEVTNGNGCTAISEPFYVNVHPQPVVILGDSIMCEGGSMLFALTIPEADSDAQPIYTWFKDDQPMDNATSDYILASEPGLYKVAVSVNGCTSESEEYYVTYHSSPQLHLTASETNICIGGTTTINADAEGDGNISYSWSVDNVFGSNYTFVPDHAGTFTFEVTATDELSGCSASDQITINVNEIPETPVVTVNQATVFEGGQITLTVANPVDDAIYTWYRNGILIEGATQATLVDMPMTIDGEPATYNYSVMAALNNSGCVSEISDNTEVAVFPTPVANVTVNGNTTFCEGSSTTLHVDVTPQNGPTYSYQWYEGDVLIPGATSADYVVTKPVRDYAYNFSVTVSDSNGGFFLTADAPAITVVPQPVVILADSIMCEGGSMLFASTIPEADSDAQPVYTWYKDDQPMDIVSSDYILASEPGLYKVAVSVNGCTSESEEYYVTYHSSPQLQLSATETDICVGGHTAIFADVVNWSDGTILYSWSDSYGSGSSYDFSSEQAGLHTITVTATNTASGCQGTNSITINVNDLPETPVVTVNQATVFDGGQVTLTVTNPVDDAIYTWYRNGMLIEGATQSTLVDAPMTVGGEAATYTYNVMAALYNSGCASGISEPAVVTVSATPMAMVTVDGSTVFCEGSSTTLHVEVVPAGNPSYTYQWYEDGMLIPGATSTDYVVTKPVRDYAYNFSVMVSDTNGGFFLTADAPAITVVPQPVVILGDSIMCEGGSMLFALTIPEADSDAQPVYTWFKDDQPMDIVSSDYILASEPGLYKVAVSVNGCTSESEEYYVTYHSSPQLHLTATETDICVGGHTAIFADVVNWSDGTILYSWSDSYGSGSSYDFSSEQAGLHTITVTATNTASGCQGTNSITINVNDLPETPVVTVNQTTVFDGGQVTLTVANPVDDAIYTWYRNGMLIDGATQSTLVDAPMTVGGEPTTYTYSVMAALYNSGCASGISDNTEVAVFPTPVANVTVNGNTTFCEGSSTTLHVDVTPQNGPTYSYQWYEDDVPIPGATSADYVVAEPARTTSYNFHVVVSANGSDNVTAYAPAVTVVSSPTVVASISESTVCAGGTATLTALVSGGVAGINGLNNYSYQWFRNADSTAELVSTDYTYTTAGDEPAGTYAYWVAISNGYGCNSQSESVMFTVADDPTVIITPAAGYNETVCDGGSTVLQANTTGGFGEISYQWYKNGLILFGENNQALALNNLYLGENYSYTVSVTQTGVGCAAISAPQVVNVNAPVYTTLYETACDDYTWNGITYTATGDYSQTFTNANGCDSVVTLHLTVNYSNSGDTTAVANDMFDWYEHTYLTMSGDYTHVFTNQNGCDSVVTLHLTVNNPTISVQDTVLMPGYFVWHGMVFTSDTVLFEMIPVFGGYDSLVIYHVFVTPTPLTVLNVDTCVSYTLNGQTYTETGDYVQTFPVSGGMDSVVVLYLTIFPADSADFAETACELFTWEGTTYTTSGDYTKTLTNANGCDSVVTLHLTVFPADSADFAETACELFTWEGTTYTTSGDYTKTLTNANGCDSVVTLHLTVFPADSADFAETACESFTWEGTTYTSSGDYTKTFTNANGCDSVVTLHLTINQAVSSEFAVETADSCYTWNAETYCASGDYTQTLTAANGCDSIVTLHLTITVGIDDHNLSASMTVYPNPTNGIVNVQCTMYNVQVGTMEYHVFDAYGKLIRVVDGVGANNDLSLQTTQIDLSGFAAGVYFVKAVADGNVVAVRKVVKR